MSNWQVYGVGAGVTTLFHPIGYAKVLIQIGHEPIEPSISSTIFGKDKLYYPNVFQYISYIKRTDGFFGLYRGLFPRILGGFVGTAVQNKANQYFKPAQLQKEETEKKEEKDEALVDWLKTLAKETSQETVSRCLGLIASQPFHVVMLRSMAQFVGGEKQYSGIYTGLVEIYQTDGIRGFFAGIVPRIIGEVIAIWLTNIIASFLNKYFIDNKEMKSYTHALCGLFISVVTYPFQLVSNIMGVNEAELIASPSPKYKDWTDCWSELSQQGQLKRGSSIFFRQYNGPVFNRGGKMYPAKSHMFVHQ
ncbi:hypothetical protein CHS0354_032318 [Potamilus streckersoni]|uniref:Uncharacterized protein n=1 Tax=Potamilus streckersoni TaxID=2493646 RepID=A0AAE0RPX8_9BIVA|nr:hypothetical protein CHS0354_032318 [Potamilus streckersoni]